MGKYGLRIAIYGVVIAVAGATFGAAHFWNNEEDLWMNLFAEIIGVGFTVMVIDQLLRADEIRRTKPARYAAFREVSLVFGRTMSLWHEMIKASFDPTRDREIIEIDGISLFDSNLGIIVCLLNLDSEAPVIPKRDWRRHLIEQSSDIEHRIDRCLQRYAGFLDPEMIKALQDLERDSFFLFAKLLDSIKISDQQIGIDRGPYFGWGANNTADDFVDHLKTLGAQLEKARKELAGLPDIPDTIDLHRKSEIESLRSKLAPAPDSPTN